MEHTNAYFRGWEMRGNTIIYDTSIIGDAIYVEETTNSNGDKFIIGDWVLTSMWGTLMIGEIKSIRVDGLVTFENISPDAGNVDRFDDHISHCYNPYTTAYLTSHGYGSSNNDKTKGSYPYFKSMMDKGHL